MTEPASDELVGIMEARLKDGRTVPDADVAALIVRIRAQEGEIERLRAALEKIAAECFVSVGTYQQLYERWRKLATERVDIARAALKGGDE